MGGTLQAAPGTQAAFASVYDGTVEPIATTAPGVPVAPVAPVTPVTPTASVASVAPVAAAKVRPTQERSQPDQFMRRLLRIPDERKPIPESDTNRIFGTSILLSATRCLLSYIVLPILLPAIGLAKGVGPIIGIPIGILALTFDFLGIRRFWLADHHQRWLFTGIYAVVGAMVLTLLIVDIYDLVG